MYSWPIPTPSHFSHITQKLPTGKPVSLTQWLTGNWEYAPPTQSAQPILLSRLRATAGWGIVWIWACDLRSDSCDKYNNDVSVHRFHHGNKWWTEIQKLWIMSHNEKYYRNIRDFSSQIISEICNHREPLWEAHFNDFPPRTHTFQRRKGC